VDETAQVDISFEHSADGSLVTVEVREWATLLGEHGDSLGWLNNQFVAPLLSAMSPAKLGDWITDRVARRPSGRQSRDIYRDPLFHYPNFRVILEELAPASNDYMLEVGCGGGAMLREVLKSGCRAAAIDHSLEMIRVARDLNRDSVAAGRLKIVRATANRLPFRNGMFTCAAMTGVLGFLTEPVEALSEIGRTLVSGGRLVVLGSDPELKGTPAAPEPIASRLRFYEDDQLEALGRDAGFRTAQVIHRDLEEYARDAGVPEEIVPLFSGVTRFLVARKD
jgi:SAM-dependent methyltransferase